MLDVITVVSPPTPKTWVTQCLESVETAAHAAPFDVRRIVVPGIPGNIGAAMAQGLVEASGDYVAWVDDDDYVLPHAFTVLEPHFAARPAAIFARELIQLANGRCLRQRVRHHLTAFRRDVVEAMPMADYATHTSRDMRRFAEAAGPTVDVLEWVYVYRVWASLGFALRRSVQ